MSGVRSATTEARYPRVMASVDAEGKLRDDDGNRVVTPRTLTGRRVQIVLSKEEESAFEAAWDDCLPTRIALADGTHATLRRADCGSGCYCDALVVPEVGGE